MMAKAVGRGPVGESSWTAISVDLDLPIGDIATNGSDTLLVTVFTGQQPLGRTVVPAPLDPMPGKLLTDHLEQFTAAVDRARISEALSPSPGTELPTATIIVCTRNRPIYLERCLTSLRELELEDMDVIVVDNGDDDRLPHDLADSFGARYVREPVPGLDRARNRGLLAAATEIVLFVDDDVQVTPTWATHLLACFEDPLTVAATGLVLPDELHNPVQIMFERYTGFVRGWERKVFDGTRIRASAAGNAGAGASFAFRREALLSMGGFAEELDAGRQTQSGGDTYALYCALRAGWRVTYEPKAVAFHTHRDTVADLEKTVAGYGTGVVSYLAKAVRDDHDPGAAIAAIRWGIGRTVAGVVRSTRPTGSIPLRLRVAETRGMLAAPFRLAAARRSLVDHPPLVHETGDWVPTPQREASSIRVGHSATRVTVVIPTRNRKDSVLRLLDFLESQDYPRELVDIVVTADGDTDGTVQALHRRGHRPVTVLVASGEGSAVARNRGAVRASGDVILFLDDDVEPIDGHLISAHVAALQGHAAAVGAVHPQLDRTRLLGKLVGNWWIDMSSANRRADPLTFTDVCAGNLSISTVWFNRLGGFDDVARREDWLLGWRLLILGGSIASAGGVVLHHTSSDPAEALEDRFEEGQGDVQVVQRFPEAYALLPLAGWDRFGPPKRKLIGSLIARPGRGDRLRDGALAAHHHFERLGLTDRATDSISVASQLAYWSGVASIVGGVREWHQLVSRGRRRTVMAEQSLELTDAATWVPPSPPVAELPVTYEGRELGVADLAWGGIPWSRRAFADAVADRFGPLALEARAIARKP